MKTETNKPTPKCFRWAGGTYDDFLYSKTENFDFDEYVFSTPVVNGYCLTAEITKAKGEPLTEEEISAGFAVALFEEMKDTDFNANSAKKYFTSLPFEFYTKETYDLVCKKVADYNAPSSWDAEKMERNLSLFKEYAYFANDEEIPAPQHKQHNGELSRV